jgi:hypothetical protein
MWETSTNWALYDPIIPRGVFALNIDNLEIKIGNGSTVWSSLGYVGGTTIGDHLIQSDRDPLQDEILIYDESSSKWLYRLHAVVDTATNWESNNDVFPTFALLVEKNELSNLYTGRFKISDGVTQSHQIPWAGSDIDLTSFPTGYGIKFNGTQFEAAHFIEIGDSPASTIPTGIKFARDDGIWAEPGSGYVVGIPGATNNSIVVFDGTSGYNIKNSGVSYLDLVPSIGTPNASFQINNGVKLFDVSGELHVKTATNALSHIRSASLYSEVATHNTVYVGGYPTEATSVTLTGDGTYLYVDGGKLFTNLTGGHGSGSESDLLDGYHASEFATLNHIHVQQPASGVLLTSKIGSTYNNVQQWVDVIQSSGRISGGLITAHSPANGTVDVSALTGFIKLTDDSIGNVEFFDLAASTSVALTDNQTNYIYVTYNSGNPQILVTTDRSSIRQTDQFTIGRAFRSGTAVEVLVSGINLYNKSRLIHEKWIDTFGGVSYASGLTVSATGLKPAFTAGVLYAGSNKINVNALDCNTSGTFNAYYTTDNGTTWTIQTAQTSINNTQYNNAATGLADLSNNQYGVHWLYICPEGSMYMLYGKASYTLAQAQAATGPVAPIPNYLAQWAKLAAKIIVLKSATSIYSITLAWSTQFPVQLPGDHNSLASLQGGTSGQYYHLTSLEYTTTVPRYYGELASAPATYKPGDSYWNTGDVSLKTFISYGVGWKTITTT